MYFAHDDRQKVCLAGESRTKFDSPEFCDGDGKASNPSAVGYGLWVAKVVSFRQLFALHFADGRQLGTIHGRTSPMRVANARCVVGREPGRSVVAPHSSCTARRAMRRCRVIMSRIVTVELVIEDVFSFDCPASQASRSLAQGGCVKLIPNRSIPSREGRKAQHRGR
jgi:hypothetical protein